MVWKIKNHVAPVILSENILALCLNNYELISKSEWEENIESDIEAGLKKYGGLNPEYFAYIRKLSIQY